MLLLQDMGGAVPGQLLRCQHRHLHSREACSPSRSLDSLCRDGPGWLWGRVYDSRMHDRWWRSDLSRSWRPKARRKGRIRSAAHRAAEGLHFSKVENRKQTSPQRDGCSFDFEVEFEVENQPIVFRGPCKKPTLFTKAKPLYFAFYPCLFYRES